MKYLSYQPPKANSFGHSRKAAAVLAFEDICERFTRELCAIGGYHDIELVVRFREERAVVGLGIIRDLQQRLGNAGEESICIQGYDPPSAACHWKLKDGKRADFVSRIDKRGALRLYLDSQDAYDGDLASFEVVEAFSFRFTGLAGYDQGLVGLSDRELKHMHSLVIMTNGGSRYVQPTFHFPLTDDLGIAKEAMARIQATGLMKLNPAHFRVMELTKNWKLVARKLPAGLLP